MGFVTFEEIMETIAREQAGVIVRNCAPKSVEEAKEAARKTPGTHAQDLQDKRIRNLRRS